MFRQIFNYDRLKEITKTFVAYSFTLEGLSGAEKKEKVIDLVIDFQQKNYNIKFLPDSIEVLVLKYLLDTLIEEVYDVLKSEEV